MHDKTYHWVDKLADTVEKQKKPPFIITGGLTTSGPTHLGTVCEFLYPATLKQRLVGRRHKADFYFIADIMDAFDSIPLEMQKYADRLTGDLGKPLVETIDPLGCHKSFGEHYLADACSVMERLELQIEVLKVNDIYSQGKFDPYAIIFLAKEEKVKRLLADISGRDIKEFANWSPIMPICEECGRIATVRVTSHDSENYTYADDMDVGYVKGCGYTGQGKLSQHRYKLQWRLHWPAWQAIFNTSAEGAGMDHFTKGGSWDTAVAIHKQILKREPPVGFKYGFVLFEGGKYSKSKGKGMSVLDIVKLIPPEVVKYMLFEPNLPDFKDINPNGEKFLRLIGDLERLSELENPENDADRKKLAAYRIAIGKLKWHVKFTDILLYYQIYRNWGRVGEMLSDADGVNHLAPYITEWLKVGFAPDRYSFSLKPSKVDRKDFIKLFIPELKSGMSDLDVHNLVYSVARSNGIEVSDAFKDVYSALIGKSDGPRIGKLITAIGINRVKELLKSAIS